MLHLAFRKGDLNFCVHGTPQRVMPHEQLPLTATAHAQLTNGARDHPLLHHWRELPQVSFCRDKDNFKGEKGIFVAANILLSRQKTRFVAKNRCLSRQKGNLWQLPPMILLRTNQKSVLQALDLVLQEGSRRHSQKPRGRINRPEDRDRQIGYC